MAAEIVQPLGEIGGAVLGGHTHFKVFRHKVQLPLVGNAVGIGQERGFLSQMLPDQINAGLEVGEDPGRVFLPGLPGQALGGLRALGVGASGMEVVGMGQD